MRAANDDAVELVRALAEMYAQYCPGEFGHMFMSAGENAIGILEDYGVADEKTGVDFKALLILKAEPPVKDEAAEKSLIVELVDKGHNTFRVEGSDGRSRVFKIKELEGLE